MGHRPGEADDRDLNAITPGERAVYRTWQACLAAGREPSAADLARLTGYAPSNVGLYARMLVACGLIDRMQHMLDEPEYRPDDPSPIWIAYRAYQVRAGWQAPAKPRRRPTDRRGRCRAYVREWRQMRAVS